MALNFLSHPAGVPYGVIPVMNISSSPVFDVYQTIHPHLNNNYQPLINKPSLSGGYTQGFNYPAQLQRNSVYLPGINGSPPGPFYESSNNPPVSSVRRDDNPKPVNSQGKGHFGHNFSKRDGWSSGWGSSGSVSKSPAISALALLGFLFFLNLIQNSLQNNRLMLTNTLVSNNMTSTTGTSAAVVGRNGRVRRKRGFGYEEHNVTPESIPTHPNRQIQTFLQHKDDYDQEADFHVRLNGKPFPETNLVPLRLILEPKVESRVDGSKINNEQTNRRMQRQQPPGVPLVNSTGTGVGATSSLFQKIKRASLGCIQLAACNVGRSLHSQIGPRAGLFMRMLRQSFPSSKRNRNNWTTRMAKALTYGWTTKRDCFRLFRNCFWNPQYKHEIFSQGTSNRRNP